MLTGILSIEDDGQLFLNNKPGVGNVLLQPDTEMEIRLGGRWIAGQYVLGFEKGEIVEHIFQCGETSFCGLCSGMRVRVKEADTYNTQHPKK